MNVQRIEVLPMPHGIVMRLWIGHASAPACVRCVIDPKTALELSSQLESAMHVVKPEGLEPNQAPLVAAVFAAAAAKPISVAQDDLPIS